MARFELAIEIGRPSILLAAAHELPKPLQLQHAVRILLLLAVVDHDRFGAAAARFGSRLVSDRRLNIAEAQLAFAALATLVGPDPAPGAEALCRLLDRHGEHEAAEYVAEWLRSRSR
jgi:hypothetical protein